MIGFFEDIFSYINKVLMNKKKIWFLGFFTSIVSISSVVSFFIPLKIILILENPSSINGFISEDFSINLVFYSFIFVFFVAVIITIFGKLYISKISLKLKENLWSIYKSSENAVLKKVVFDRVFKKAIDINCDIISIVLIFSLVLFLDFYISLFLIICFFIFVSYARKVAFDSLKKEYQIIFQTFGNICFYLTFILIIALYFGGLKIVLINILLAFMLSRLYFRSLSSFSINLISIHKELKKQ